MKRDIVIDANNAYVQGLVKVINEFMLEEAEGCLCTELRLKNKIEKLKEIFGEERKRMVLSGDRPVLTRLSPEQHQIIFKQN